MYRFPVAHMQQKNFAHFIARVTNEDIGDDIICAKLLLVDLAGSEGAKRMGADAMPFKGRELVLGFQSVTKWLIR